MPNIVALSKFLIQIGFLLDTHARVTFDPMHIILLNQFYWPETMATSQILSEVARSLAEEHEVTVICGGGGDALCGSVGGPTLPLRILRIHNASFRHSWRARIVSYLTYLCGVIWHGCLLRQVDCFVTLTTPPILPVVAGIIARVRGARHVIWEMDVYPDIASDIGIFRKQGMLEKVSGTILDWSRRRADIIIVIGEDMRTRILARGISPLKIRVAENWADGATIVPTTFPDGPLTVHYSGNLGLAHEVATIAGVMGHFANHRNFHFIFSGGGPRRPELEAYCRAQSIRNVEFRPFCASDKLSESLGQGHLGLITQLPETLGSVVPSKIYGIMAAGRPVLYIGPDGSTAVRHIQNFNCGWRLQPGDVEGVIRLLNHLDLNRHLLSEAGERGRIAFERNFDRTIGVARILAIVLGSPLKESSA